MSIAPGLQLRTGQSLALTPQLRQAIHLLTLGNLELDAVVADAVAANPLLDDGRGGDSVEAVEAPPDDPPLDLAAATEAAAGEHGDAPAGPPPAPGPGSAGGEAFDFDRLACGPPGLHDHLTVQAGRALGGAELAIATQLIAHIDPAGYLTEPLSGLAARLGVPSAAVEAVLTVIHGFDPTGVGARDLAECVALQLREVDRFDPAMATLLAHLPLLAQGALPQLRRLCGVDADDLAEMIREVRACNPKPGLRFGGEVAIAVQPDLFVTATATGWTVALNDATLPRPVVDRAYLVQLRTACVARDRAWLNERLADANGLVRALDGRQRTILTVASELVRRQDEFFRHGVSHLRPLTMAEVADAVGLHETTVSRVAKGKYLACDRGTIELRWFFTGGVAAADGGEGASAAAVKARIAALVAEETEATVLSDDQLMAALKRAGVVLARRTVAKYREAEGIGSSVARRRRLRMTGCASALPAVPATP